MRARDMQDYVRVQAVFVYSICICEHIDRVCVRSWVSRVIIFNNLWVRVIYLHDHTPTCMQTYSYIHMYRHPCHGDTQMHGYSYRLLHTDTITMETHEWS
jgi:hypothetical protein